MNGEGFTVWCTGLSGSGKSAVCEILQQRLYRHGMVAIWLDGDALRKSFTSDLGFSGADRLENALRVARLSSLLNQCGLHVLVSLISPYAVTRAIARETIRDFRELYVRCSLEECQRRDPKGLYRKAVSGEIPAFTGISDPYEAPEHPEFTVDTERAELEHSVGEVLAMLERDGLLAAPDPEGSRRDADHLLRDIVRRGPKVRLTLPDPLVALIRGQLEAALRIGALTA